jgi:hypothetical protein
MMIGGMAAAWLVPRTAWGAADGRVRRQHDARALVATRPDVMLVSGTEFTRILARLAQPKELKPAIRRVGLLMHAAIDGRITR